MMQEALESVARPARRFGPGSAKLVWLVALGIATLLPTTIVTGLVSDREAREDEAATAIAHSWGPPQVVSGPALLLAVPGADGRQSSQSTTYARVAPKALTAEIEVTPERRHRGFFEATVYTATVHVKGSFHLPETIHDADEAARPLPHDGMLAITLSSFSGVAGTDQAAIGSDKTAWQVLETSPSGCDSLGKILFVPARLGAAKGELPFEATLHLRGTQSFAFGASAKTMDTTIKGAWGSPGFIGDEPPLRFDIAKSAFSAQWRIDGIGTPVLTTGPCAAGTASASRIGVDLVDPLPVYLMVMRAAKYAPLFVVFAFAAYFACELLSGIVIAILQYALMAASLTLFALLLVSLSEIIGYVAGYAASAALITAQATIYTASVTRRMKPAAGFGALLAGLFGCLYVLLGLESYALVVGATALFIALSIVMAVTQHVQPVPAP